MGLRGLKFYTVKEVASIMQVRIETVLRWIYARKLKASKLPSSRIWRIREEDIIEFMEQGLNIHDDSLDTLNIEDEIQGQEDIVIEAPKPVTRNSKKSRTKAKSGISAKGNDMYFDFSRSKNKSIDLSDDEIEIFVEDNVLNEKDCIFSERSLDSSYNINSYHSDMLFCDIDEGNIESLETIEIF